MSARSLHQLLAGYSPGDAISNEARWIRAAARRRGLHSEIYCERRRTAPEYRSDARELDEALCEIGPHDAVLLHLSIGSPANELLHRLRTDRRALLYHNITPPEWFVGVRPAMAALLAQGIEQARALVGQVAVLLADSSFNARELEALGHRGVNVFPLALDFSLIRTPPDPARVREWSDGRLNVLFVGRGVPNKRIEDLLATFYYLERYVEKHSRLLHIGSYAGCERYLTLLRARAREWRLEAVEFPGPVSQAQLSAAYRTATVFLCLSEHEGFCVPLVEAMAHDVPVIAYAAGAVPETLGTAGVLVRQKRWDLLAELIYRMAHDRTLRDGILARQRARVAELERRQPETELWNLLAPILE